ncbi:hypothetical protein ACAX43_26705 [Paraburkholderia sp. IW21]|uniref:hypothetical protein n=1 Tax=Paraburkholderia sp. IW21 TaxID=3242488 RepID=UPI00351FCBBB
MEYRRLSKEDFDAIVTGELTHYAIWFEDQIVAILADHFATDAVRSDFVRLFLRRDGLTFQDKIEIARAAVPSFKNRGVAATLPALLTRVETFKSFRNAFAHGIDETPENAGGAIHVEVVNRAGKAKVVVVTPDSHEAMLESAERLLSQLKEVRDALSVASSGA